MLLINQVYSPLPSLAGRTAPRLPGPPAGAGVGGPAAADPVPAGRVRHAPSDSARKASAASSSAATAADRGTAATGSPATSFAQTYRSGHIFSFILGGIAVCIGLSGFMAPHFRFEFAGLELLITFLIILNAWIGNRNQWHRRWLDYRQLAERLRPMRSLRLLGIAAPDPPGTDTNPVPRRWIANSPTRMPIAVGMTNGSNRASTVVSPSTADRTEIAGVIIESP